MSEQIETDASEDIEQCDRCNQKAVIGVLDGRKIEVWDLASGKDYDTDADWRPNKKRRFHSFCKAHYEQWKDEPDI